MKELAIKLLKAKYDENNALKKINSEDFIRLYRVSREIWVLEYLLSRTGITQEEAEELNRFKKGEV